MVTQTSKASEMTDASSSGSKEGRPNPDAVHFGFVAKSHAEVNAFFVAAIAAGGREKTAPAPQLQYHPDYYATWVLDPDGHEPPRVSRRLFGLSHAAMSGCSSIA